MNEKDYRFYLLIHRYWRKIYNEDQKPLLNYKSLEQYIINDTKSMCRVVPFDLIRKSLNIVYGVERNELTYTMYDYFYYCALVRSFKTLNINSWVGFSNTFNNYEAIKNDISYISRIMDQEEVERLKSKYYGIYYE